MSDTPFIVIAILIILASIVTLLSTPLLGRISALQSGVVRAVAYAVVFVIVLIVAYGGWRVLSEAGGTTIAFHQKQAKQLEEPILLR
ncbi:hypothetical protein [Sphingomonas beigongshangi]|uniref:hypothetical protein n=1 Tax=Sphingomonas beigongshangi TaxID=2782540 RepID=UPI00193BA48B|nr:hypothetical protein [Sphingomonas beigongshangi]